MAASQAELVLPRALGRLRGAARARGVELRFMPPGMKRREENTTRLAGGGPKAQARRGGARGEIGTMGEAKGAKEAKEAKETKQEAKGVIKDVAKEAHQEEGKGGKKDGPRILWRLELLFALGGGGGGEAPREERVVVETADELSPMGDVLAAALGGCGAAGRHRLRRYVEAAAAGGDRAPRLLLKKTLCRADRPLYYALDSAKALGEQLAGRVVIEFPTVRVALPEEVQYELDDEASSSSEEESDSSDAEGESDAEEGEVK